VVTIVPFNDSVASSFGTAVNFVGLNVGRDLGQHQALLATPGTDPVQGRFAAGAIERAAQNFAINGHDTLALLGKLRHETLKGGSELFGIELTEQPAERVVTGYAVLQLKEAAQERLFCLCEQRHVDRALATAQHRAQSDHQKLMEVMQTGVPGSGILQTLPARRKLLQGIVKRHIFHALL
jgi:hypothetical protein